MKHVWMANEGSVFTVFDSENEYIEYKQATCGVFFFTDMKKDTRDLEAASVVFVRDEDSYLANEYEFDSESINGPGWYVWSSVDERYLYWDEIELLYEEYRDFIKAKKEEGLVVNWK